jgi:SAM-dependent methyltransferase
MAAYGSLSSQFLTRLGVSCLVISCVLSVFAVVFGVGKELMFSLVLIASFLAAGMVSLFFAYRAARFRSRLTEAVTQARRSAGLDLSTSETADLEANWNQPGYWQDYYGQLQSDGDASRQDRLVHKDVDRLIRMLIQVGELPANKTRRFLDAGCGVALIPHILSYWGFSVTAVDLSQRSIEFLSKQQPSEEELARCVSIWERVEGTVGEIRGVRDFARSMARLRSFQASGGSASYLIGDWLTLELPPQSFDVVRCFNSLRHSTKAYWHQSLLRFHELLAPGGILLLENLNVFDRQFELETIYRECGFTEIDFDYFHSGEPIARVSSAKYVISIWPTG